MMLHIETLRVLQTGLAALLLCLLGGEVNTPTCVWSEDMKRHIDWTKRQPPQCIDNDPGTRYATVYNMIRKEIRTKRRNNWERKEERKAERGYGVGKSMPFASSLPEEAWLLPTCRVIVARSYLAGLAKIMIHWLAALVVRTFYRNHILTKDHFF